MLARIENVEFIGKNFMELALNLRAQRALINFRFVTPLENARTSLHALSSADGTFKFE
jgi:hypothetical protein